MEGKSVFTLIKMLSKRFGEDATIVKEMWRDQVMLDRLQDIHDNYLPEQWEHEFQHFAETHGLTMPV